MPRARSWVLPLLALLVPAQAAEITVSTTRSGDTLRVEASAEFEGGVARAWQVLIDYDRLAAFVPDFYVPPLIGTLVLSHNVESAFRALVNEMERVPGMAAADR